MSVGMYNKLIKNHVSYLKNHLVYSIFHGTVKLLYGYGYTLRWQPQLLLLVLMV